MTFEVPFGIDFHFGAVGPSHALERFSTLTLWSVFPVNTLERFSQFRESGCAWLAPSLGRPEQYSCEQCRTSVRLTLHCHTRLSTCNTTNTIRLQQYDPVKLVSFFVGLKQSGKFFAGLKQSGALTCFDVL